MRGQRMKHTIKFRKSIINANWVGDYSVVADSSIINIVYNLAKERMDFKIKKLKIRGRYSNLRSKVVVYSEHDIVWDKFVVAFLEEFNGYIENISIK